MPCIPPHPTALPKHHKLLSQIGPSPAERDDCNYTERQQKADPSQYPPQVTMTWRQNKRERRPHFRSSSSPRIPREPGDGITWSLQFQASAEGEKRRVSSGIICESCSSLVQDMRTNPCRHVCATALISHRLIPRSNKTYYSSHNNDLDPVHEYLISYNACCTHGNKNLDVIWPEWSR